MKIVKRLELNDIRLVIKLVLQRQNYTKFNDDSTEVTYYRRINELSIKLKNLENEQV